MVNFQTNGVVIVLALNQLRGYQICFSPRPSQNSHILKWESFVLKTYVKSVLAVKFAHFKVEEFIFSMTNYIQQFLVDLGGALIELADDY